MHRTKYLFSNTPLTHHRTSFDVRQQAVASVSRSSKIRGIDLTSGSFQMGNALGIELGQIFTPFTEE